MLFALHYVAFMQDASIGTDRLMLPLALRRDDALFHDLSYRSRQVGKGRLHTLLPLDLLLSQPKPINRASALDRIMLAP